MAAAKGGSATADKIHRTLRLLVDGIGNAYIRLLASLDKHVVRRTTVVLF